MDLRGGGEATCEVRGRRRGFSLERKLARSGIAAEDFLWRGNLRGPRSPPRNFRRQALPGKPPPTFLRRAPDPPLFRGRWASEASPRQGGGSRSRNSDFYLTQSDKITLCRPNCNFYNQKCSRNAPKSGSGKVDWQCLLHLPQKAPVGHLPDPPLGSPASGRDSGRARGDSRGIVRTEWLRIHF